MMKSQSIIMSMHIVLNAKKVTRCPLCNSYMLKRITLGSKILAAATMGSFALPYNSKICV